MVPGPACARTRAIAVALALAFAVVAAAPLFAAATITPASVLPPQGSTSATPTPLAVPAHASGKLFSEPGQGDCEYWYQAHLTQGQTLSTTLTAAPSTKAWAYMFSADQDDEYAPILSDTVTTRVEHLSFEAEHTGDYFLSLSGSKTGSFTVDAAIGARRTFALSALAVPVSATHGKSFGVSVKIAPGYNSPSSPLRFYLEKKSGGVFRPVTWTGAFMTWASTGTSSKGSAKFTRGKGTYRVRARFKDAAHPTAKYTGWKTIKIT